MAAEFKKGDRVRCTGSECDDPIGKVGVVLQLDRETALCRFDEWTEGHGANDAEWWLCFDELVPVAEATGTDAPLTIRAGKYYRTRDGRKVGPMVAVDCGEWVWETENELSQIDGCRAMWREDGTFSIHLDTKHQADLVAEWNDDPAIDATTDATVPPTSTAGFTVPLCAYDEEQPFEWLLDKMADAYQRGFKDGLSAQLTR